MFAFVNNIDYSFLKKINPCFCKDFMNMFSNIDEFDCKNISHWTIRKDSNVHGMFANTKLKNIEYLPQHLKDNIPEIFASDSLQK